MTPGMSRRRALAGAAVLGAIPALAACGSEDDGADPTAADPNGTDSASSDGPGGDAAADFASTANIPEGSGVIFADQGVVVTQPTAGQFKGFTNICTHQQCPVTEVTETINCACHGSKFSLEDGSPVEGPASAPLDEITLSIADDSISLA